MKRKQELEQLRKGKKMELKAYSVRDAKAEAYNLPFFKHMHGEAEREFTKLARDPQSQVNQFPEDYDLYYVGNYDLQTGVFKALDTPQHMLKAISVKA